MANSNRAGARDRYRLRRGMLKYTALEPESAGSEVPGIDPAEHAALQEKAAALVEENAQLRDTVLRQKAEFDNYRRRTLKEKDQIRDAVREDLMIKLLPVVDNFDRALEAAATATEPGPIRDGVAMVADQLRRLLESEGLQGIEALNQPFNPEEHEAIAIEERTDVPDNHVSSVMLPGYRFRDKTIRAAMVKVARAPQAPSEPQGSADTATGEGEPAS